MKVYSKFKIDHVLLHLYLLFLQMLLSKSTNKWRIFCITKKLPTLGATLFSRLDIWHISLHFLTSPYFSSQHHQHQHPPTYLSASFQPLKVQGCVASVKSTYLALTFIFEAPDPEPLFFETLDSFVFLFLRGAGVVIKNWSTAQIRG